MLNTHNSHIWSCSFSQPPHVVISKCLGCYTRKLTFWITCKHNYVVLLQNALAELCCLRIHHDGASAYPFSWTGVVPYGIYRMMDWTRRSEEIFNAIKQFDSCGLLYRKFERTDLSHPNYNRNRLFIHR